MVDFRGHDTSQQGYAANKAESEYNADWISHANRPVFPVMHPLHPPCMHHTRSAECISYPEISLVLPSHLHMQKIHGYLPLCAPLNINLISPSPRTIAMLEIAVFTPTSALTAYSSGASRIELCTSYHLGGTTPSLSTLLSIRQTIPPAFPILIMIRPRSGDFHYSTTEFEAMRASIALFSNIASGFVFGILNANGRVDVARNSELVDIASPLACTFHRAIDEVNVDGDAEWEGEVGKVVECGFARVLTSGRGKSAVEGMRRVRRVQERFGARIEVVAGGGVRCGNVEDVKRGTGVGWVHSAAVVGEGEECDGEEVRRILEVLEEKEYQEMDG